FATSTASKHPASRSFKRGRTIGKPHTEHSAISCSSSALRRGRFPTWIRSEPICPRCWPPKNRYPPSKGSSGPRDGSSSRPRRTWEDDSDLVKEYRMAHGGV